MMLHIIQKLNRCDWFLFSWVLYYLQGILYPEGGILSISLLSINLIVSICCATKVIQLPGTPLYFKGLNMLLCLFTIYGFIYILVNPSSIYYPLSGKTIHTYNYIKSIYLSLLPIYAFYYFTRTGYLTKRYFLIWGGVFLVSVVLSYFKTQQEMLNELIESGSSMEEITNNSGYLFVSCLPLLVLYKKYPILQFLALAIVLGFIVMGMKRGAIVIGIIAFTYFVLRSIRNYRGGVKIVFILLIIILCFVAVYFFEYEMANSDYMAKRLQDTLDGNSSGRDNLYTHFWDYFIHKANLIHFLFGRGANGTLEVYYNFAHNDWLEIAVGQGLLGIYVYFFYWKCLYKTIKKTTNSNSKTILVLMMIIFFMKTFFSMSYVDMSYVCTSVLGYALATMYKPNC